MEENKEFLRPPLSTLALPKDRGEGRRGEGGAGGPLGNLFALSTVHAKFSGILFKEGF